MVKSLPLYRPVITHPTPVRELDSTLRSSSWLSLSSSGTSYYNNPFFVCRVPSNWATSGMLDCFDIKIISQLRAVQFVFSSELPAPVMWGERRQVTTHYTELAELSPHTNQPCDIIPDWGGKVVLTPSWSQLRQEVPQPRLTAWRAPQVQQGSSTAQHWLGLHSPVLALSWASTASSWWVVTGSLTVQCGAVVLWYCIVHNIGVWCGVVWCGVVSPVGLLELPGQHLSQSQCSIIKYLVYTI